MGDMSYLRFVPASSAAVTIDWSKVPEASKKYFLEGWCYNWTTNKQHPLPATIGDLANTLDKTKFFGYMNQQLVTLLLDINEFGLDARLPTLAGPNSRGAIPVGPRFYMKYLNNVWVILFMPGKRDGITAFSPKMDIDSDGVDSGKGYIEEREDVEGRAMAEEFDPRLCNLFGRFGKLSVLPNGKIADWSGSLLSSTLEEVQLVNVLMELPAEHPARREMLQGMMKSFADT